MANAIEIVEFNESEVKRHWGYTTIVNGDVYTDESRKGMPTGIYGHYLPCENCWIYCDLKVAVKIKYILADNGERIDEFIDYVANGYSIEEAALITML